MVTIQYRIIGESQLRTAQFESTEEMQAYVDEHRAVERKMRVKGKWIWARVKEPKWDWYVQLPEGALDKREYGSK